MGENDTEFKHWLKEEIDANVKQATDCAKALGERIKHQARMASIEHGKFVSEPLGHKSVTEVPGIGEVLGGVLKDKGFVMACQLLQKYLTIGENEKEFKNWLETEIGANEKEATYCTEAFGERTMHQARMASLKHGKFVSEPLGDKPVTEVPGIGEVLGGMLKDKGFGKAYQLLQVYLIMGENDTEFKHWLKEEIDANVKQATDCAKALGERIKHQARMASIEHGKFVSEPLGHKSVTEVPGIGEVLGGRLKDKGFVKACQLLQKYLTIGENETEFKNWLKTEIGANEKEATYCTKAFGERTMHQARMASLKHGKFVSEPLGDKPVTEVPGIGEVLGGVLKDKGFGKAYKLLGKYLNMEKNDTEFQNWLKREIGADQKEAPYTLEALKEWCRRYMD